MPTYEYACTKCGHHFEQFQSMNDARLVQCPKCRKKSLKRLVGAGAGLIFKGTGFYITDYKKPGAGKEGSGGGEGKSAETKSSEGKGGESKPADSKPAESKPSESKQAESKPAASKPAKKAGES